MDRLGELLADRSYFTRKQALASGETDQTLEAAVRSGAVARLRHGAYAATDTLGALGPPERHLLTARAVVAQQRGRVALAGPTAALLRGYDVFGHDLDLVHVARLDRGSGRRQAGVVHHHLGKAALERVQCVDGLAVVSAADAVWEVALLSHLEGGVVTADSALRRRPALGAEVYDIATASMSHPRSRTARLAIRLARPQSESVGESLTRVAFFRHGIPSPELQHDVFADDGRHLGRTDFWWPEARLLGEFDGRVKYDKLLKPGEKPSDVVVREKHREDEMRATSCGMARFVWAEVQPDSAARRMARLRQQLEQSRRLYVLVAG